jgi:hypothetical protein
MIYTPSEYSKAFLLNKKRVSAKTVIRRAVRGLLPSNHKVNKLKGRTGCYLIEVKDSPGFKSQLLPE